MPPLSRPGGTGAARVRGTLLPLVVLGAGACGDAAGWERPAPGRRYFDPDGRYVHAGVSARTDVDVEPLDLAALGGDTAAPAVHLYRRRCGSCHQPPDPGMSTAEHWSFLIPRMRKTSESAGLIPMSDAEADTILAFLGRHARR